MTSETIDYRKEQEINEKEVSEEQIQKAVKVLKEGGVIIYPTETVYGLGADISNQNAVEKIFLLKGREARKPLLIAVKKENISEYAVVSEKAQKIIDKYLPGPVSLLLPKKDKVPDWITPTKIVGIRVPSHPIALELIDRFGAITSTSTNLAGSIPPHSIKDVDPSIAQKVDYVLDSGETEFQKPSTLIKVDEDGKLEIIRQGAVEVEIEQ